ncbi:MAG: hypothetical protein ACQCN6_11040 [Candidatus Bathyarchaeia archaeon]
MQFLKPPGNLIDLIQPPNPWQAEKTLKTYYVTLAPIEATVCG